MKDKSIGRSNKEKVFFIIGLAVLVVVCVNSAIFCQDYSASKTDLGAAIGQFSQLSENDKNSILAASGLPQTNSLDPSKILAWIIFGSIGTAAFIYGKKSLCWRPMVIGVALMLYPYFLSNTLWLYIIGAVLTASLYFFRE